MRLLLIVLVLLNLLALASTQGWLGSSVPRGEPERLTNQLNPEKIVLLPAREQRAAAAPTEAPAPAVPEAEEVAPAADAPPSAPTAQPVPEQPPTVEPPLATPPAPPSVAAAAEPDACVAYTDLTAPEADALAASARSLGPALQLERAPTSAPTGWWVRIPPTGSREAAEREVAQIRALGISDYFIVREPGPHQFSVSLGLFRTEAKALEHLAFMQSRGVTGAQVAPRDGSSTYRAEVRGPSSQVAALQRSEAAGAVATTRSACEP